MNAPPRVGMTFTAIVFLSIVCVLVYVLHSEGNLLKKDFNIQIVVKFIVEFIKSIFRLKANSSKGDRHAVGRTVL